MQLWTDRMASEGEEHLKLGRSSEAFAIFRRLQMTGPKVSST